MRYQIELEIAQPRERVIELFLDPQNLAVWQPGFVSIEQIGDGGPRQVGTKSRQIHKMGRREVEVIETITAHDYPDTFSAVYESQGIWHHIENRFIDVNGQKTKWILDTDFKCTSIVLRLMTAILPGLFKKQMRSFMNSFKEFAETDRQAVG